MWPLVRAVGWIACVVYSTIPLFWLMIHPRADRWRERTRSPYLVLVPAWVGMWAVMGAVTFRWREAPFYQSLWSWIPAGVLFCTGVILYRLSGKEFGTRQLSGLPEIGGGHAEQRLVTTGIRARVRHPVYLGHLCEMLAWSLGTGLAVCWALTGFAVITGAAMIRIEDQELERRFGEDYRRYRAQVAAVLPRLRR
jgi:protein-S-isoprenylcysteine O-methyltransferase Ste14